MASQAWSDVSGSSSLYRAKSEQRLTVRDLGSDVVGNVGLADTVQNVTADGAHESSVDGRESTSREGPFLGRVVG